MQRITPSVERRAFPRPMGCLPEKSRCYNCGKVLPKAKVKKGFCNEGCEKEAVANSDSKKVTLYPEAIKRAKSGCVGIDR